MAKNLNWLSSAQRRAIAELLTGGSRLNAATAARVHVSTLYRWFGDPAFVSELQRRQTEAFDVSISALRGLSEKAIETLDRNLNCGKEAIEVRAALGLISLAVRLRDDEIRDRVDRLEALLREDQYDFSEFRTLHSQAGKKTAHRYSTDKPFCEHKRPAILFPDGTDENADNNPCRICNRPQLIISISYKGYPGERVRMLREARMMLAESEYSFPSLDRTDLIEVLCEEFEVTPEDLVLDS